MNTNKQIVIDTNILYYWCGTEVSDNHNPELISDELSDSTVFISQLSILEFIIKYENHSENIFIIHEFLARNHIGAMPFLPNYRLPYIEALDEYKHNGKIDELIAGMKNERISIESDLLAFLIESAIVVLSHGLMYFDDTIKIDQERFYHDTYAFIASNQDFIKNVYKTALSEFYNSADENASSILKSTIHELLDSLMYVAALNHNLVENKMEVSALSSDSNLSQEELNAFHENLKSNRIRDLVLKQFNNTKLNPDRIPFFRRFSGELKEFINEFEHELITNMNMGKGIVRYYSILLEKLFTTGKKIEKNDMIDSVLLNAYPNFQLLTADKKLRSIIKSLDRDYYLTNEEFLSSIKPPSA